MNKLSTGRKIFEVLNTIFMICFMVAMIYPMWFILVASFSDNSEVMKAGGSLLWIKGFTTAAYKSVFKLDTIWSGYGNTLFILVVGVFINILLTALGGYFLSRKNVFWGKYIAIAIVFTMYFSGGIIPFYFTVKDLHLDNSLWALILPTAISTYNMIIMRTAFSAIPDSLEESAKLDGAKQISILFRIMFPLAMPTVAVLILYYGVHHWNSWFNAMIFLRDRQKFPLQLILREIVLYSTTSDDMAGAADREAIGETIQYATIVVATAPILLIYPFMQRYFVKGVMIGAVKG
ncbi:MAG: carbohydrate ABC transporter permease [Clostridia bacterium]|nr:carbohydrate ABC transporter permease [Clostridia bacterium]